MSEVCPITACGTLVEDLKAHALQAHLPVGFYQLAPGQAMLALQVLRSGARTGNICNLINILSLMGFSSEDCIPQQEMPFFRAFAEHVGEDPFQPISLNPVTRVTGLVHWRAILTILDIVDVKDREAFRTLMNSGDTYRKDLRPVQCIFDPIAAYEAQVENVAEEPVPLDQAWKRSRKRRHVAVGGEPAFQDPTSRQGSRSRRRHRNPGKLRRDRERSITFRLRRKSESRQRRHTGDLGAALELPSGSRGLTPEESDSDHPMGVSTRGDSSGSDVSSSSSDADRRSWKRSKDLVYHSREGPSGPSGDREPPSTVMGFDAHFHLDRLHEKLQQNRRTTGYQGPPSLTLASLLNRCDKRQAINLPLRGAVSSFCDVVFQDRLLRRHRESPGHPDVVDLRLDNRLYLAFGLHPKHAERMSESEVDHQIDVIKELHDIFGEQVVAVGEVGLDYSRRSEGGQQLEVLRKFIQEMQGCIKRKVLVLHFRDSRPHGQDVAQQDGIRLLNDLVREGHLDADQRIQLHFFQGGRELVERWVGAFPNTYFSFSGAVQFCSGEQRQGIRAVPADRMLLETDAPHVPMKCTSRRYSAPFDVHFVAGEVARILNRTRDEVLRQTTSNAQVLFRV